MTNRPPEVLFWFIMLHMCWHAIGGDSPSFRGRPENLPDVLSPTTFGVFYNTSRRLRPRGIGHDVYVVDWRQNCTGMSTVSMLLIWKDILRRRYWSPVRGKERDETSPSFVLLQHSGVDALSSWESHFASSSHHSCHSYRPENSAILRQFLWLHPSERIPWSANYPQQHRSGILDQCVNSPDM